MKRVTCKLDRDAPGLLPQDAQGNQLHQRMNAHNQVRLVVVEGRSHLLRHEEGRDGLCGDMDEARLLSIVPYPPHQAVPDHEGVCLGQLIEGVGGVVRPHINIVHLNQYMQNRPSQLVCHIHAAQA